jgi:4-amino-4-deoxy-L-arabinose transferase-like glycosyltransferase
VSLAKALDGPISSRLTRLTGFAQSRRLAIEVGALTLAVLILLVSTLPNLANHPTITDDEMWVFSASYKLAEEGVFGSDMFAGFFHADQRYFFNMPGHHLAIAAAFKLLGAGVAQARLVGVVYGIATLVLTYLLARRLYGVSAAILAIGLLLFLRLNMGFDTGLPLQELAVNMRYDLAPVPFILGGVLLLLGGPSLKQAGLAGLLFGLAILMQFYGAFILPMALAFLWLERLPVKERLKLVAALLGAAALVGLPYGAYILADYENFKGQAGTIDRRAHFDRPGFYTDNLLNEPDRFLRPLAFKEVPRGADHAEVSPMWLSLEETLTRRPSAKLAVIVGLPVTLLYLGRRYLQERRRGDLLLLLCLGGLVLQYALFESAKFYIYWVPVVPFLCIGIAATVVALLRLAVGDETPRDESRGSPNRRRSGRVLWMAASALTGIFLLIVFAEGTVARVGGLRTAPDATNYERLSVEIERYVPDGSRVVGSTSLWWGMRDTDYRSYFLFFYLTRPDAGEHKTTISGFLNDFDPEYLVLTRLAIGELETHLSPGDWQDYGNYLSDHGTLVARIEGPVVIHAYGFIDIWKLD